MVFFERNNIDNIDEQTKKTLQNAELIAKKENIRVSFLGFPDIIERAGVEKIIKWEKS